MHKLFVLRICEALIDQKRTTGQSNECYCLKQNVAESDGFTYENVIRTANGYDFVSIFKKDDTVDAKVFYVRENIDVTDSLIFELLGQMVEHDRNIDILEIFSHLPTGAHGWSAYEFNVWNKSLWSNIASRKGT